MILPTPEQAAAWRNDCQSRDADNQTRTYPVLCKFGVAEFVAAMDAGAGGVDALDGGMRFERGGTLLVAKVNLPPGVLEDEEISIQQADLSWLVMNVDSIGGLENPVLAHVRMMVSRSK